MLDALARESGVCSLRFVAAVFFSGSCREGIYCRIILGLFFLHGRDRIETAPSFRFFDLF